MKVFVEKDAVEQILAQLAEATVFSTLDANSGFWQIPLSHESALLTTFISPYGRYCFKCLPFGISSAPEHFQRQVSTIFSGLTGVVCLMDDILIHGKTQSEHDSYLEKVLSCLQESNLTLNAEKCKFSQNLFASWATSLMTRESTQILTKSKPSTDSTAYQCVRYLPFPRHDQSNDQVYSQCPSRYKIY